MTAYIVLLNYDIRFQDSDEGYCFAGEGSRIVRAFTSRDKAISLLEEWNPILAASEKETIVFPVQPNTRKFKAEFGFDRRDVCTDGYNFKLVVQEVEIE